MLINKHFIFLILLSVFAPLVCSAADDASKSPEAYVTEKVFEFEPVVEGTKVSHEFVIQNQGDAPLAILDLKSG